jgi:hypothetical protein
MKGDDCANAADVDIKRLIAAAAAASLSKCVDGVGGGGNDHGGQNNADSHGLSSDARESEKKEQWVSYKSGTAPPFHIDAEV